MPSAPTKHVRPRRWSSGTVSGLKLDKEFIHTHHGKTRVCGSASGCWMISIYVKPRSLLKTRWQTRGNRSAPPRAHCVRVAGDYFDKSEGEMPTRIRMEAQRAPAVGRAGEGISAHYDRLYLTLENYPTAEVNQEYLLMTCCFVQDNAQHSQRADQHFTFSTRLNCTPPARCSARVADGR